MGHGRNVVPSVYFLRARCSQTADNTTITMMELSLLWSLPRGPKRPAQEYV